MDGVKEMKKCPEGTTVQYGENTLISYLLMDACVIPFMPPNTNP